ncbi:hypothetical protein NE237_006409 [Protea cynaroides]|uniref:Uncharacterized protein n=1 Tax=Protea cynaroides TaxID=273540 RepID=A0A9Q0KMJ5_9MAGN|nr:hypothetical protein NE237_006409 [Protea cynaroides]
MVSGTEAMMPPPSSVAFSHPSTPMGDKTVNRRVKKEVKPPVFVGKVKIDLCSLRKKKSITIIERKVETTEKSKSTIQETSQKGKVVRSSLQLKASDALAQGPSPNKRRLLLPSSTSKSEWGKSKAEEGIHLPKDKKYIAGSSLKELFNEIFTGVYSFLNPLVDTSKRVESLDDELTETIRKYKDSVQKANRLALNLKLAEEALLRERSKAKEEMEKAEEALRKDPTSSDIEREGVAVPGEVTAGQQEGQKSPTSKSIRTVPSTPENVTPMRSIEKGTCSLFLFSIIFKVPLYENFL